MNARTSDSTSLGSVQKLTVKQAQRLSEAMPFTDTFTSLYTGH